MRAVTSSNSLPDPQVGANVGFFTLLAAKRGYDTLAFEPAWESVTRLLYSLQVRDPRKTDSPPARAPISRLPPFRPMASTSCNPEKTGPLHLALYSAPGRMACHRLRRGPLYQSSLRMPCQTHLHTQASGSCGAGTSNCEPLSTQSSLAALCLTTLARRLWMPPQACRQ